MDRGGHRAGFVERLEDGRPAAPADVEDEGGATCRQRDRHAGYDVGQGIVGDRDDDEVASGDQAIKVRSEEHTSETQSLLRISYAVFCLKKNNKPYTADPHTTTYN